MAIVLSDNMKNERIIVGEYEEIKRFFGNTGKDVDNKFIVDVERPIGQFIKDFIPKVGFMREMQIEVSNKIFDRKLQAFFDSGNPVYQYVALRTLQERHTKNYDPFYEFSQDLQYHMFDSILQTQRYYARNPFIEMIPCTNSRSVELIFEQRFMKEVAVITYDLLPLAMWYMRKIYDKGYFLQKCRLCEKVFLAKTATIEVLCGKRCKRKNAQILKSEHSERTKGVGYEQKYKTEYMYWYNRLKNFDKNSAEYKAFRDFCKTAIAMKKQVKSKGIAEQDFLNWLYPQRNVVDELVGLTIYSRKEKRRRNRGGKVFDELKMQYQDREYYKKWLKYAEVVAKNYYNDVFDFKDFEYMLRIDVFLTDPKLLWDRVNEGNQDHPSNGWSALSL